MSSSDDDSRRWGTIFMGPSQHHEATLDTLKNKEDNLIWTERTEAEYLARVRQKAVEHAKEVLRLVKAHCEDLRSQAREDAQDIISSAEILKTDAAVQQHEAEKHRHEAEHAREEAQRLYDGAHEQGYNDGIAQAQQELELFRAELGVAAASVIQTIGAQCQGIYERWREELVQLLHAAVEKSTGLILSTDRAAMLENVFMLAVRATASSRQITVRVNPEDAPLLMPIIEHAKTAFPTMQISSEEDASITPGGLVLDSEYGRVEHGVEHCRSVVEDILRNLSLPNTEVDTVAVSNALEKAREVSEPFAALQDVLDQAYGHDAPQPTELHMPSVPDLDAPYHSEPAPVTSDSPDFQPNIAAEDGIAGTESTAPAQMPQDLSENSDFDIAAEDSEDALSSAPNTAPNTATDTATSSPDVRSDISPEYAPQESALPVVPADSAPAYALEPLPSYSPAPFVEETLPGGLAPEELESVLAEILPDRGAQNEPQFFGAAVGPTDSAYTDADFESALDAFAVTGLSHDASSDDMPVITIKDDGK